MSKDPFYTSDQAWLLVNSVVSACKIACFFVLEGFRLRFAGLCSNQLRKTFSSNGNGDGNGSGNHPRRHTTYQTQKLEEFYKECPHSHAAQQDQLGMELGIEPKRIRFWFQNRRTQAKVYSEKAEAHELKLENEKLKRERDELEAACDKLICPKCVGSSHGVNMSELNRREMIETSKSALTELIQLLESCDPFWVKSPINGRLVLDGGIYNTCFPKTNRFNIFTQIESSKDSTVVALSARALVEMFMDASKWQDLFPTIVLKARMIEVVDTSTIDDDAGILQLMHAKLHIMSPLVAPRDIYFLRYNKEIRPCRWVIVDLSCDYFIGGTSLPSWKRPSGCLIQDMFNGSSQITWMEHVEVDSRHEANNLYEDIFSGGGAYGAERWLVTLHRMVERQQCYAGTIYHHEQGGIYSEMRKNVMDLSHDLVKAFVAMLSMSTDNVFNLELPGEGHVSVNRSNKPGQAGGMVLAVSNSVWLPVSCEALFSFLRDDKTRSQWDVLPSGNSESEFAHISCGTHPGNRISLIQTSAPGTLLLQESCRQNLDSLIVYTPMRSLKLLESAFKGQNPDNILLAPSGFIISGDQKRKAVEASTSTSAENSVNRDGSMLTVALQVMTTLPLEKLPYKTVESATTLTHSIIKKIKVALGCPL